MEQNRTFQIFHWNISQKQICGKSLWSDETTEEGSVSCYFQFLRSETGCSGHHNKMDILIEKGIKCFVCAQHETLSIRGSEMEVVQTLFSL